MTSPLADEKITIHSGDGVEISLPLVGIGGRSYAFVIDWHVRALLALAWLVLAMTIGAGGFGYLTDPALLADHGKWFWVVIFAPSAIVYFLYHPILELLMSGQTPGKRKAGVRIVTKDGLPAGSGALVIRNVFRLIDSLPAFYAFGVIFCLFNRPHARLGDLAAGTILIYEEDPAVGDISPIINQSADSVLSPELRDIAVQLLDRWTSLTPEKRVGLCRSLLERAGQPVLEEDSPEKLDSSLRSQLQELLDGDAD